MKRPAAILATELVNLLKRREPKTPGLPLSSLTFPSKSEDSLSDKNSITFLSLSVRPFSSGTLYFSPNLSTASFLVSK